MAFGLVNPPGRQVNTRFRNATKGTENLPVFTFMLDGVTIGDSGICCYVPFLLSAINSLCFWFYEDCSQTGQQQMVFQSEYWYSVWLILQMSVWSLIWLSKWMLIHYTTLLISRLARGEKKLVTLSKDLPIRGMDELTFSNRRLTYPSYGKVNLFQ